ncbi:uncharacterized protein LOC111898307 [Lactuca sativa]|uniref:Man1/Src1-like C-terminal domain-containing protein n=1 Tax=Lactuca sativa TaxID=4236 RepID=A0A9R1X787_LACSA|nr:uncharacterized protein LOC111898307 [Lactuca sativa]KAJ0201324.1 hypothetical protein LSAT_V11C600324160 [Lactuca sativa]
MASTPKRRIRNPKYSSPSSLPPSPMRVLSSIEPPPSLLPSKTEIFKLVAVVSIAVSVAAACNIVVKFFNRQPKPFCDTDSESDYYLSEVCDPCPSHGICYEGKLECTSGYTRHGRSCLEDGSINEMAKNLAKMVESHVCESYSEYLCKGINKVWFRGDELWNNMDKVKLLAEDFGKGNATYLFAKNRAMDIVDNLLEMRDSNIGIKEFKCPELLVEHYKPLSCSVRLWLLEHALFLIPFCVLLVGCVWMLLRVHQRHYLSVRAEELYEQVCDTLEEAALVSRSINGEGEGEPWIVASWLRDNVLTPKERRNPMLWKKVEELVQEDSRLDRYPKMLKGEPKVVWEWQVEGSSMRSSGKKKSEVKKQKSSDLGSNQDQSLKPMEPLKW